MTDVQETWKKHGWVPPSQQEAYTLYWEHIKNPACKKPIPEIFILQSGEHSIFSEHFLKNNTCRL